VQTTSTAPAELLTVEEVQRRCGRRKSAIYEDVRARKFPAPVKVGRSSRWDSREIQAWIDARIAERDARATA
jgi:prophage regulatory protein